MLHQNGIGFVEAEKLFAQIKDELEDDAGMLKSL